MVGCVVEEVDQEVVADDQRISERSADRVAEVENLVDMDAPGAGQQYRHDDDGASGDHCKIGAPAMCPSNWPISRTGEWGRSAGDTAVRICYG
jgi:hypothetical protein